MQTAFFIMLDGAIILFLYFKNPFATLRGRLAQYYFEAITLLVHLCTFILALQDTFPHSSSGLRKVLSTGIIYLNTALISGSVGFLFIETYKTISQKNRETRPKKVRNNVTEGDTSEAQSILPHIQSSSNIETQNRSDWMNNKRDSSRENSHLFQQSSNNLNLSMNTDDHIIPHLETNHPLDQQRGHSMIRGRPQPMEHHEFTLLRET